jgi:outer membrane receptor protein involved in Fe transport
MAGTVSVMAMIGAARAADFNIPAGDLKAALGAYMAQSGVTLLVSGDTLKGARTNGVNGSLPADSALSRLLSGTGFTAHRDASGLIGIVKERSSAAEIAPIELAQAAPAPRAVETVTVTSSKLGGADVQSIPIAITALSQEQLTSSQTNGGPDLIKQVPNMSFTKTNFSGYSIQLRGIGTQAVSVTTDPAVAVALNDIPFIRNHFFEQEFFDLSQAEVLRGPQGTLYGRNATAGVVNLTTARPTDQFEAMASGEIGNYQQRRFEGMLNLPILDDRLDLRFAGEWTKRQGYSFNQTTDERIDGRDLWSGRVTVGFKPTERLQTYLVWEHFSENDDRLRSGKQLCKTDPGPETVANVPSDDIPQGRNNLSQGCLPTSLYSADAFGVVNGRSLPYYQALSLDGFSALGSGIFGQLGDGIDPYADTTQSHNLRVIQSSLEPSYKVKNDTLEFNADYTVTPALTFTSQTGFNRDALRSTEDYNRFNTSPGLFLYADPIEDPGTNNYRHQISPDGYFCDPQLGCQNRLVAEDMVDENAWQLSQEFRLASHFDGPFNFSVGGNYMHYETVENYYVFINAITLFQTAPIFGGSDALKGTTWVSGVSDNHECLLYAQNGLHRADPTKGSFSGECGYIDPNPIGSLDNQGHNYFLSQNPYVLNSYAAFGESYYDVTKELKLTAGLRYTDDQKHFTLIPSEFAASGYGYPSTGTVDQSWGEFTGRFAANWTPKLSFTDQTLFYGSYAHGYKAGGANPPGAVILQPGAEYQPTHPLTFKPEFIDAFELGTKNTLLDGALTLNGDVFYYNYENYQISQIVDRTSVNQNFDAHVKGAEIEAAWEPVPGLRFNFAGGYESSALAKGSKAIDLMDRTAGNADWVVVKPAITEASNCILPAYVAAIVGGTVGGSPNNISNCQTAYVLHQDPALVYPLPANYPGFDPTKAPNNGAGFDKDLSGNELPNAPPLTVSMGAQYTMPLTPDWAGTIRGDYYWQDYSWARVYNDNPYDRLRGYTNVNLTFIFTNQNGWQVMLYDKNVFNTTAITGAFLNSDDSGLTTNVFLTDPKLIGIRVTKNW